MKNRFLILALFALPLLAQRPPFAGQIQGVSGNGPMAVTSTGAQTPGACVVIDGNGNHVASVCPTAPTAVPTTLVPMPNSTSGTVVNQLARLGAGGLSNAVAGTSFVEGIVVSGAGTNGTAQVAVAGLALCNFGGSTQEGDWVGASAVTAGLCVDLGAASTTGIAPFTFLVGRVLSTNATAGTYMVDVQLSQTLTVPSVTSGGATSTRQILVDPNNNYHIFPGVDAMVAAFPLLPANGDSVRVAVSGGTLTLQDAGPGLTITLPNGAAGGGTVLNTLARLYSANTAGPLLAAGDPTSRILGIVVGGAGTTGNAQIQVAGIALCQFDGSFTNAGQFVVTSTITNGYCHVPGTNIMDNLPPDTQIIGVTTGSAAGAGLYPVAMHLMNTPGIATAAGATATTPSTFVYDTAAKNYHLFPNGADGIVAAFQSSALPTSGQVFTATVSAGNIVLTPITGFSGTKAAGACTFTLLDGYVTNVSGC